MKEYTVSKPSQPYHRQEDVPDSNEEVAGSVERLSDLETDLNQVLGRVKLRLSRGI